MPARIRPIQLPDMSVIFESDLGNKMRIFWVEEIQRFYFTLLNPFDNTWIRLNNNLTFPYTELSKILKRFYLGETHTLVDIDELNDIIISGIICNSCGNTLPNMTVSQHLNKEFNQVCPHT